MVPETINNAEKLRFVLPQISNPAQKDVRQDTTMAMVFEDKDQGDNFSLAHSIDAVEIHIEDPLVIPKKPGEERITARLYITLNRKLEAIMNDPYRPQSEMFDKAISNMTLDRTEWYELHRGWEFAILFNCANCGNGLNPKGCRICGYHLCNPPREQYRETRMPLSRKMVDFLRANGFKFRTNPGIAWAKELHRWERGSTKSRKQSSATQE